MTETKIDFDRLLKLRLVVARVGEMDLAKWWNTRGQLGRLGTAAIRRGFPRTHYFAQARSVFAVAAHRSREIFDPPDSVTLWRLPEPIEEEFEATGSRGGFMIAHPISTPRDLLNVTDYLVPELQRRGRFRTEYEGKTLKENLKIAA